MSDQLDVLTRLLNEEDPDIENLSNLVTGNDEALKQLVDGLTFSVDNYRYNCNTVLVNVARKAPKFVYSYWDNLVGLLESDNTYHRCSAINILPHLIPVDGGLKFIGIIDSYFRHLDDKSVIPPCYIARNCGTIASHLPEAVQQIVKELLAIDKTRHKQGRKDLIKADIIQAFDQIYEQVENKAEVCGFVEDQLNCSSPKTRKAAKAFLKKYGGR
jgi:hypothetical protein